MGAYCQPAIAFLIECRFVAKNVHCPDIYRALDTCSLFDDSGSCSTRRSPPQLRADSCEGRATFVGPTCPHGAPPKCSSCGEALPLWGGGPPEGRRSLYGEMVPLRGGAPFMGRCSPCGDHMVLQAGRQQGPVRKHVPHELGAGSSGLAQGRELLSQSAGQGESRGCKEEVRWRGACMDAGSPMGHLALGC